MCNALLQVAAVVRVAQAERRTLNAGAAEDDEVEEWTSDQLSDAAAVASSVLARHGAASQVRHWSCLHPFCGVPTVNLS